MDKKQPKNKEIISDYNRIYSGPGIRTNSGYYRWLAGLLRVKPGARLLDVSCGEGIFLREVLIKAPKPQVFGLDISDVAVSIASSNSPAAKFLVADGQGIPFKDKTFDYVTCLGSLEHYLDPGLGIKEIVRIAKDDARFCVILPNSFGIDLFLHLLREGGKPVDNFQIIEKTATKKEWALFLENNGLSIRAVYGSNLWPELFVEGTFKLKSLTKFMRRLLIKKLCPVNLAREFVFICDKKQG